tara:strand:+ start:429 stop:599 length:171 start_codon:yes stop_codon:yes gene_type:complete
MILGNCKFCEKPIINKVSFVSFIDKDKTKAHHQCSKNNYYKQLIEKNKNEKRLSQN